MFRQLFSSLFIRRAPIFLGRWKLKYEEQQVNRCVLWANEDNCGCCDIEMPPFNEDVSDDFYLPYIL
jgi:hypothetical protein